jgi:hypothetical protein
LKFCFYFVYIAEIKGGGALYIYVPKRITKCGRANELFLKKRKGVQLLHTPPLFEGKVIKRAT